jgi:hypothetical protein
LSSAELYDTRSFSPPLSIGISNNIVTIWWQSVSGWTLQQNGNPANTNGWSVCSGVINADYGTSYLVVTNSAGNLFFRLH